jgi:hypothetical protein
MVATATMSGSSPTIPPLAFGERFRVKSRAGNEYVARFLHRGQRESGLFVRLDTGQIARLDPRRLLWSTFAPASELVGEQVVGVGDEVLVECAAGDLRGRLEAELGGGQVCLDNGLNLPGNQVHALSLMFRAPELMAGDRFFVRSRSDRAYSGTCLAMLDAQAKAHVRLDDREEVNLRLKGIDMSTLYVAIPLPRSAYAPDA